MTRSDLLPQEVVPALPHHHAWDNGYIAYVKRKLAEIAGFISFTHESDGYLFQDLKCDSCDASQLVVMRIDFDTILDDFVDVIGLRKLS